MRSDYAGELLPCTLNAVFLEKLFGHECKKSRATEELQKTFAAFKFSELRD